MTQTTQTLKQKVAVLLAESDRSIINDFFNSEITDESHKYDSEETTAFREVLTLNNLSFKHVANHGGEGEGEGEDFWSVYKFSDSTGEVYVQFQGYYMSYDGSTFQEFFFVVPREVSVVQYFKDKE